MVVLSLAGPAVDGPLRVGQLAKGGSVMSKRLARILFVLALALLVIVPSAEAG